MRLILVLLVLVTLGCATQAKFDTRLQPSIPLPASFIEHEHSTLSSDAAFVEALAAEGLSTDAVQSSQSTSQSSAASELAAHAAVIAPLKSVAALITQTEQSITKLFKLGGTTDAQLAAEEAQADAIAPIATYTPKSVQRGALGIKKASRRTRRCASKNQDCFAPKLELPTFGTDVYALTKEERERVEKIQKHTMSILKLLDMRGEFYDFSYVTNRPLLQAFYKVKNDAKKLLEDYELRTGAKTISSLLGEHPTEDVSADGVVDTITTFPKHSGKKRIPGPAGIVTWKFDQKNKKVHAHVNMLPAKDTWKTRKAFELGENPNAPVQIGVSPIAAHSIVKADGSAAPAAKATPGKAAPSTAAAAAGKPRFAKVNHGVHSVAELQSLSESELRSMSPAQLKAHLEAAKLAIEEQHHQQQADALHAMQQEMHLAIEKLLPKH